MKTEIIETIRRDNTNRPTHPRLVVNQGEVAFDLPGRGGKATRDAAKKIESLLASGVTYGDIARQTNCNIAG